MNREKIRSVPIVTLAMFVSGWMALPVAGQIEAKEPNRGGTLNLETKDPAKALEHLHPAKGYAVNLFASEKDFPIGNPVSLTFDAKGRLWVSTMPTYPQAVPGVPPNDKLIILEDTDGDGKADKHTVFMDHLYLPGGFELGDGGAYIAQMPNLIFAKDNDGDDVADESHVILHGFSTGDSHHAISAFTWGPGGGLYFQEGTFHRTQVETPYGMVRVDDAAVFRFDPWTYRFSVFVSYRFANPWGHVFDRWGQNFIADASGGANYFGSAISGHVDHPRKHAGMKVFTSKIRPTAGCEIVSSRQFPENAQGNFLVNNCISFHGIKQHRMIEEGSGFTSKEVEPLLLSSDINFRPVDLQFGPDGALYIADWWNPLIGHMQYSVRDSRRDHQHGRIWRVTYKGLPLLTPPKIAGRPLPALLDLLKEYEDRTRYRVRAEIRRLASQDPDAAVRSLKTWIAGLDKSDANYEHHLLEALWVYQTIDVVEPDLLKRMLRAEDGHARAAATRVLRYWLDRIDDALPLLRQQVNDVHPRVRLEAILALSFMPSAKAAEIALEALKHPNDYYLDYVLTETMATLEPYWKPALTAGNPFAKDNPAGLKYVLERISTQDLAKVARSEPVYQALLRLHGVSAKHRREALDGLAKLHHTSALDELFAVIEEVDKDGGTHADHVLHDLGNLLAETKPVLLHSARNRIAKMTTKARRPRTRQGAFAALIAADGSPDRAWELASKSPASLRTLIEAIERIPDGKLRSSLYPKVKPILDRTKPSEASPNASPATGRYVRIELPGEKRTLTLAEVQVHSDGANIAPSGEASQSSVAYGGKPKRAIDGKTYGQYSRNGQTHTRENERNPWWELDLGDERPIDAVTIWNRTEANGRYANRLNGFTLRILDENRELVFSRKGIAAPPEKIRIETHWDSASTLRRVAIAAVATMRGYESETFATLASFVRDNIERMAAIRALARLPKNTWPKEQAPALIESLVKYVSSVPLIQRSEPDVLEALQLGKDLASLLPTDDAKRMRKVLRSIGATIVLIRTVPHKMIYDRKTITVQAGRPVEIVMQNRDIMPHNLVIAKPGALAEVGEAAEKLAIDPRTAGKVFVPDSPKILHTISMLQPGESAKLRFIAPQEPGQYPYLCTFPGHWLVMNGILNVVEKLDEEAEYAEATPEVAAVESDRKFIRLWTLDDLLPELARVDHGRSIENAKKLFTDVGCIKCHKFKGEGAGIGPDLTEVAKKYKRPEILREMMEPSKVINEKFQAYIIQTKDNRMISGFILHEDDKALRIAPNLMEPDVIEEIPINQINAKKMSTTSLMPTGLLTTLTKDDILDLVAYLETGASGQKPSKLPAANK